MSRAWGWRGVEVTGVESVPERIVSVDGRPHRKVALVEGCMWTRAQCLGNAGET